MLSFVSFPSLIQGKDFLLASSESQVDSLRLRRTHYMIFDVCHSEVETVMAAELLYSDS